VRSRAKVTIDSQEVAHEKSIGSKVNDIDLCLGRIKIMSTTASHTSLNISETIRDREDKERLVPKDQQ